MKVLLMDNVPKLGKVGDILEVKRGYARNYLIPMRLAVVASPGQISYYQDKLQKAREKYEKEIEEIKLQVENLSGKDFVIEKKATEEGKLFAAVVRKDIEKVLEKEKVNAKKINIDLGAVDKKLGKYPVKIDFGGQMYLDINIEIVRKK
ncbi:MAG TPA: 50S ribosomal protein L9 [bacterium]|nr:50S ribosomal protein L9 [bacterium]HPN67311.1 50S ribosomal protein L9 [bacterium]